MADFIMAANGLATQVAAILAPATDGTVAAIGAVVKIYVGWPNKQTLDLDLAAKKVHVSIWPLPQERMTSVTKDQMDWYAESLSTASRETQRRTRQMQIGIWAANEAARDTVGGLLEAALSDIWRIALADGTQAVLSYAGGRVMDEFQTVNLYRRDILMGVNYGVLQTQTTAPVTQFTIAIEIDENGTAVTTTQAYTNAGVNHSLPFGGQYLPL
jgi:hypothetical protein